MDNATLILENQLIIMEALLIPSSDRDFKRLVRAQIMKTDRHVGNLKKLPKNNTKTNFI